MNSQSKQYADELDTVKQIHEDRFGPISASTLVTTADKHYELEGHGRAISEAHRRDQSSTNDARRRRMAPARPAPSTPVPKAGSQSIHESESEECITNMNRDSQEIRKESNDQYPIESKDHYAANESAEQSDKGPGVKLEEEEEDRLRMYLEMMQNQGTLTTESISQMKITAPVVFARVDIEPATGDVYVLNGETRKNLSDYLGVGDLKGVG